MKSLTVICFDYKNFAAGESFDIFPAGEIWSVVIESPKFRRHLALTKFVIWGSSKFIYEKKGGLWIYVESFHSYRSPFGASREFHLSVPVEIFEYTSLNISGFITSIVIF